MKKALIGFIFGAFTSVVLLTLIFDLPIHNLITDEHGINISQIMAREIYEPDNAYVPDAITAAKIAEAVWIPIYGNDIYNEKPFNTKLDHGVWKVTGSLPKGSAGGVAEIYISMADGKILKVSHGK